MRQNNKGFSILELIVVIMIMAVLTVGVTVSVSLLTGASAKSCAQKLNAQLSATKTACMSRYDETMKLYKKADGYYTENNSYTIKNDGTQLAVSASEVKKMGDTRPAVKVYLTNGSEIIISETKTVTISYNRSNGGQDAVMVDGATVTDTYVDKIVVSQGSKELTIKMTPKTGKHKLQ